MHLIIIFKKIYSSHEDHFGFAVCGLWEENGCLNDVVIEVYFWYLEWLLTSSTDSLTSWWLNDSRLWVVALWKDSLKFIILKTNITWKHSYVSYVLFFTYLFGFIVLPFYCKWPPPLDACIFLLADTLVINSECQIFHCQTKVQPPFCFPSRDGSSCRQA